MTLRRIPPRIPLLLALTVIAGCSAAAAPATGEVAAVSTAAETTGQVETPGVESPAVATSAATHLHDQESDYQWDESSEVVISLRDGGSSGGAGVGIDGDVVTITAAGTYRLAGSLRSGQVVVDAPGEDVVRLVLDGVDISSSSTAPLSIVDADKVVVILATGSQNSLTDAVAYQFSSPGIDEPNAALFSIADLTITGEGSLTVNGNYNDGIACKDGLIIAGGTITVAAVDDGVRGKDYLVIRDGTLDVTAGGDALKSDNEDDADLGFVAVAGGTVNLEAGTDGIDAFTSATVTGGALTIAAGDDAIHSETRVQVDGGTVSVTRAYEGLEGTQIVISDGAISIVASDDGLNVAGGVDGSGWGGPGEPGAPDDRGGGPGFETPVEGYYAEISGGTLVMDAGGDGLDSNGSLTVTGGIIVVNGPTANGNGAIDVNGQFTISNAILLAAGSAGMAETPDSTSPQATLHVRFNAGQAAGTIVRIQSPDGANVATFEASKPFQSLVFSSPDVASGTDFEVLTGGSVSGDSLGGLYLDPAYFPGTSVGTVSAESR